MAKKEFILEKHQLVSIENAVTGQMEGAKVSVFVKRDVPKYKEAFTMLFQDFSRDTIRDMKPVTTKLLMYLFTISQYDNLITQGIQEIADYLKYTRRNVERAMAELELLNVIKKEKNPNDKRENYIYLNPKAAWKGEHLKRKVVGQKFKDPNQIDMFKEKKAIQPNNEFYSTE